jgi:2-haloacid dehalogenase
MTIGIGLDVYGTLVDPLGISEYLRPYAGAQAERMAEMWRAKQLEYTFRRAAMGCYANFEICTRQALEWVFAAFDINLSGDQIVAILEKYKRLPAYPDAELGLSRLKGNGYALYAFSNGVEDSLKTLLTDAGLLPHLGGVISVDEVRTFKPDPRVYAHLARSLGCTISSTWLVSCNAFDVIGAKSAGLKSAWIKRASTTVFDPWGIEPDIVARDLVDFADQL